MNLKSIEDNFSSLCSMYSARQWHILRHSLISAFGKDKKSPNGHRSISLGLIFRSLFSLWPLIKVLITRKPSVLISTNSLEQRIDQDLNNYNKILSLIHI